MSVNNKLLFEGEYLNGKQNGKGKEYNDDGELIFEGEFLNGNIIYELINGNGKVKNYDENNILIYEGEYLNGKRHGKGKEYSYYNVKLEFEGEYLEGKRSGKGKEYYDNGKLKF